MIWTANLHTSQLNCHRSLFLTQRQFIFQKDGSNFVVIKSLSSKAFWWSAISWVFFIDPKQVKRVKWDNSNCIVTCTVKCISLVKTLCLHVVVMNIRIIEGIQFHTYLKDHSIYLQEVTDSAWLTNLKRNPLTCCCGHMIACFDTFPSYACGKLNACF